jgi:hypothetical protein
MVSNFPSPFNDNRFSVISFYFAVKKFRKAIDVHKLFR